MGEWVRDGKVQRVNAALRVEAILACTLTFFINLIPTLSPPHSSSLHSLTSSLLIPTLSHLHITPSLPYLLLLCLLHPLTPAPFPHLTPHPYTLSPPHSSSLHSHLLTTALFPHLITPSLPYLLLLCLLCLLHPSPLHTFLRIPLHKTIWLILLDQVNGADPAVFQAVTLALYFLVVDDGELKGKSEGGGSEGGGREGGARKGQYILHVPCAVNMPVDC